MDRSTIIKLTVVASLLTGAVALILNSRGGSAMPDQAYFYDLGTGEMFPARIDATPPIAAPSGGAESGVFAAVFTCSSCANDKQVLYLKTHTAAALEAFNATDPDGVNPQAIADGVRVAAPPEDNAAPHWVAMLSPEGRKLTLMHKTLCNNTHATPCRP